VPPLAAEQGLAVLAIPDRHSRRVSRET
jgi:hypothetical protein